MAARVIRIRISSRGRVEYFDLDGADAVLGKGDGAALSIDHPSIARRHARLLLRRGRLILAELGGLVVRGGERLRAATTLEEGEAFRLGDVEAAAWVREPALSGRLFDRVLLLAECDPIVGGTRRYHATHEGRSAEVTVLEPGAFAPHELAEWSARLEQTRRLAPPLLASGALDGRPAIAERVPVGIRVSSLLDNLESGRVAVSLEVALAVVRRLAESLSSIHHADGPHAGLVPGAVQLGLDGDVVLLRPGPRPMDPRHHDRWSSPTRRMNLPPSIADDAYALARLGEALAGKAALQDALAGSASIRTRGAFVEWTAALLPLCDRLQVDPSAAHVARVVRLLSDRARPLAKRDRSR